MVDEIYNIFRNNIHSNTTLVKVKFTGGTITGTAHLFKYNTC